MTNNPYQAPEAQNNILPADSTPLTTKQILFSLKGRISRRTFWIYSIVPTLIVMIAFALLIPIVGKDSPIALIFIILAYIPLVWISICVSGKRWHDRDKSAVWILIGLIPFIGGIWSLVECGFLRGTEGPNQFGGDPT